MPTSNSAVASGRLIVFCVPHSALDPLFSSSSVWRRRDFCPNYSGRCEWGRRAELLYYATLEPVGYLAAPQHYTALTIATLIIIILRVSRERSGFPSGRSATLECVSHFPACLFTRLLHLRGRMLNIPSLPHTRKWVYARA